MFKSLVFFTCFLAVTLPAVFAATTEVIPILKSELNKHNDGSYDTSYETGNGIKQSEEASITNVGTEDEALEVKGSYKYINDEGNEVEVLYTAGVNGFVPYSSIINAEISAVAEAAKNLPKEQNEKFKYNKKF